MANDCLEQARAFWLTQRLRYLVPLKYTHLYRDVVVVDCDSDGGDSFGALLHYATSDIFWDADLYPHSDRIVIPTASDEAAARRLLAQVEQRFGDRAVVFKFSEPATRDLFAAHYDLTYARTLISYTAPKIIDASLENPPWEMDADVHITDKRDEAIWRLYRSNGYTDGELAHYFNNGAQAFTLFEAALPVCTAMIYQNFDTIYEIGGLHTLPDFRRRGYARRVVETALALLMERDLTPRYLVDATNTPSVQLAEALALVPALHFEHFIR